MMKPSVTVITFGPFRLVADKRELWRDEVLLKVRAMPLLVLAYLAQHPERVIPVEELRKAVWGGTRVGSGAIRGCVREIRQALGDEATAPHYIETVGRHVLEPQLSREILELPHRHTVFRPYATGRHRH